MADPSLYQVRRDGQDIKLSELAPEQVPEVAALEADWAEEVLGLAKKMAELPRPDLLSKADTRGATVADIMKTMDFVETLAELHGEMEDAIVRWRRGERT